MDSGSITNESDTVFLSTGKKVKLRKKTGAHHMIENRLLSVCIPRGDGQEYGVNIGDMVAVTDIKAVVAIEGINGVEKKVPTTLGEVIELMSEFEYGEESDEWSEFKQLIASNKEKVNALAKNLQEKAGLE